MEPVIAFGPFSGIIHQLLHALLVLIALLGRKWTAVDQQGLGQRALFGFDDIPVLGTSIILAVQMVAPVRAVFAFAFAIQFILYGFTDQLVGILWKGCFGLECA